VERWKPVVGFEDYYEVSDLGRVKSLARTCLNRWGGQRSVPERILVQVPARTRRDGKSRYIVTLHGADGPRWSRVPHLILTAFVGSRPPGHEARHLDCDPSNNRLTNLAWGTQAENHADTLRLDHVLRGERHPNAKLTKAQVDQIRELRTAGLSGPAIGAQFGISHRMVYLIAKNRNWSHV
jgi:hypothetical protein